MLWEDSYSKENFRIKHSTFHMCQVLQVKDQVEPPAGKGPLSSVQKAEQGGGLQPAPQECLSAAWEVNGKPDPGSNPSMVLTWGTTLDKPQSCQHPASSTIHYRFVRMTGRDKGASTQEVPTPLAVPPVPCPADAVSYLRTAAHLHLGEPISQAVCASWCPGPSRMSCTAP